MALRWRDLFGEDHPDEAKQGPTTERGALWRLFPDPERQKREAAELKKIDKMLEAFSNELMSMNSPEAQTVRTTLKVAKEVVQQGFIRLSGGRRG
jgi:hypothetical protein